MVAKKISFLLVMILLLSSIVFVGSSEDVIYLNGARKSIGDVIYLNGPGVAVEKFEDKVGSDIEEVFLGGEEDVFEVSSKGELSGIEPMGPDVGWCQKSFCDDGNYETNEGAGGDYCCASAGGSSGYEECTNYKIKSTAVVPPYWSWQSEKRKTDYCSNSDTLMEAYIDCETLAQDNINYLQKDCNDYDGEVIYYCEDDEVRKKEVDYGCNDGACKSIGFKNDQLVSRNGDDDYCTLRKEKGCTLCGHGDYDCDYDSECAGSLECKGPIGGATDGCCKSGETWDTSLKKCCECSSGPCCDGCNYYGSNKVCDSHVSGTDQYKCEGNCLGDDIKKRYKKQYCSGSSSSCNGDKKWVESTLTNCVSPLFCDGSTSWRTSLTEIGCEAAECTSGVCCDTDCGDYKFKSTSTLCSEETQYGCFWGTDLGDDVGKRLDKQYCSGSSSSCNGRVDWGTWTVHDDCTDKEYCENGACKAIECSSDTDCPPDSWFLPGLECKNNDVWGDFKDYTCENPGTKDSECDSDITFKKKEECGTSGWIGEPECNMVGQIHQDYADRGCSNAECFETIETRLVKICQEGCAADGKSCKEDECTDECSSSGSTRCSGNTEQTCGNYDGDSCLEWGGAVDCGEDETSSNYCFAGDVYRDLTDRGCSNDACFENTEKERVQDCLGAGCSDGKCNIACNKNSDCGTDEWIGGSFCSGEDVFQKWRTYTCNNPGQPSALCSHSDVNKLKNDCGVEGCENGVCKKSGCDDSVFDSKWFGTCPSGWVDVGVRDEDIDGYLDLNEATVKNSNSRKLCIKSDCDLQHEWQAVGCGPGWVGTGLTDDGDACGLNERGVNEGNPGSYVPQRELCLKSDNSDISTAWAATCPGDWVDTELKDCDISDRLHDCNEHSSCWNSPADVGYLCLNQVSSAPEPCTDECGLGQKKCLGNAEQTCGNYDADECLEWGGDISCGVDSCDAWGDDYCKAGDVWHKRTCHDRGCGFGACFDNIDEEEEKVRECGIEGCENGECKEPACNDLAFAVGWYKSCPRNWIDVGVVDDGDANHDVCEKLDLGGDSRLCLYSECDLQSEWQSVGCEQGWIGTGLKDDNDLCDLDERDESADQRELCLKSRNSVISSEWALSCQPGWRDTRLTDQTPDNGHNCNEMFTQIFSSAVPRLCLRQRVL